ncbi:MAG: DNA internalization-related competence protein ComEC/Rec2, partial [Candidatus Rokuibacteriota bacterium]
LAAGSAAVLALVGLAGWARVALPDPLPATTGLRPGPIRLDGIVGGEPERDGPRTAVPLLVVGTADATGPRPATGWLVVHLYGPPPALAPANRVRLTVQLSETRPFRNPGHDGAGAGRRPPRFFASGRAGDVERLAAAPLPWWLAVRLRIHQLVRSHLPPVSGALLEGLLIGERRRLPPGLLEDFRAAGIYHVLAISGFNVGLVAATAFFFLRLLRVPGRPAAAAAVTVLGAFAAVVGGQPSVLRATIMAGIVLTARLIAREAGLWNSLAAAFLVLLALDPSALADPGLQLSFGATAGILRLGPPLRRTLEARLPGWVAVPVAVSASAQLAVTPLTLVHWQQLSLIGVVSNLLVVPLAAVLTTLGLVAALTGMASEALARPLFQTLWVLLVGLRLLARGFAALPGAVLHTPPAATAGVLALGLALVLLPVAATPGRRLALVGLLALGAGAAVASALPDPRLRLVVLDVGQGDAILLRGPDGHALVVDTGGGGPGRADRGERVVLPALRRAGVRRLTALAVTHGDPDHAGGLVGLLRGIPVDEVWVPAGTEDAAWHVPAAAAGVPRRILSRGDRVWLGRMLVTVLHPPRAARGADENNRSLVLRVEWGLASALLTGDAEAPAEAEMLAAGLPLRSTVLKLGHHGSRHGSSAPFVATVSPRVGLASAGARNPFGHPSPAALARLALAGATTYRTDHDGAVEVTSDGTELRVRAWGRPAAREVVIPLRGAP